MTRSKANLRSLAGWCDLQGFHQEKKDSDRGAEVRADVPAAAYSEC